jgi:hypothetical protein
VLYAEFRDRLEGALREAGLLVHDADRRVEAIDLADPFGVGGFISSEPHLGARNPSTFLLRSASTGPLSTRLKHTVAKKTSSRSLLVRGGDRLGQSAGGRG